MQNEIIAFFKATQAPPPDSVGSPLSEGAFGAVIGRKLCFVEFSYKQAEHFNAPLFTILSSLPLLRPWGEEPFCAPR